MKRKYAVSLGSLAMAVVVIRGALFGELASHVAVEAIMALAAYSMIGAVAGWIADHLVRETVEHLFRRRVEWYRQGLLDAGFEIEGSDGDS